MIKVLIVDDIPETREHLTKLLSFEEGIDVAGGAGSGEEARHFLATGRLDQPGRRRFRGA